MSLDHMPPEQRKKIEETLARSERLKAERAARHKATPSFSARVCGEIYRRGGAVDTKSGYRLQGVRGELDRKPRPDE